MCSAQGEMRGGLNAYDWMPVHNFSPFCTKSLQLIWPQFLPVFCPQVGVRIVSKRSNPTLHIKTSLLILLIAFLTAFSLQFLPPFSMSFLTPFLMLSCMLESGQQSKWIPHLLSLAAPELLLRFFAEYSILIMMICTPCQALFPLLKSWESCIFHVATRAIFHLLVVLPKRCSFLLPTLTTCPLHRRVPIHISKFQQKLLQI